MGIGAFVGALFSANRKLPTHRLLALAGASLGVLLIGAALAPNLWLELAVLIPMGVAMTTFQATANSLLQLNSEPRFRGRVMALYVIVFIGSTPIGGPIVGWVAQQYGARSGLALGGVAALAASIVIYGVQTRRRVGATSESHNVQLADSGIT
jgi:MFS family permease